MRHHIDHGRKVTITRTKLLDTLRENRDKHEKEYLEAMSGWLRRVQAGAAEFVEHVESAEPQTVTFRNLTNIRKDKPNSYVQSYSEAIEMFEWDEQEKVELGVSEFRYYVKDKWDWKDEFAATYMSNSLR